MIYWLGLAFVLFFAFNQVAAFALISAIAFVIICGNLLNRRAPTVNVKDLLFLCYAPLAFIPVLDDIHEGIFWIRIVVYPWLITFVFQNISYTEKRLSVYLYAAMVVSLAVAGVMLFQVEPGQFDVSLQRLVTLDRNVGYYYMGEDRIGPNTAAFMSAAAIIVVLTSLRFARSNVLPRYALLIIPLVFLIVSGGRNAWVSTGFCILLYAVYHGARIMGRHRQVIHVALLAVVALTIVPAIAESISHYHADSWSRRLAGLLNPTEDHNFEVRLIYWGRALSMIADRPLGWGFNAYVSRYDRSPHNELLGQLIGAGWLATVVYVILIAYLWWHVWKGLDSTHPLSDRIRFACLCVLTVTTLAMLTEHISRSTMNTYAPIFWMIIGMSFGIRRQHSRVGTGRLVHDSAEPVYASSKLADRR